MIVQGDFYKLIRVGLRNASGFVRVPKPFEEGQDGIPSSTQERFKHPRARGLTVALIGAVLAIATLAAYWPVLGADFISYDDTDEL